MFRPEQSRSTLRFSSAGFVAIAAPAASSQATKTLIRSSWSWTRPRKRDAGPRSRGQPPAADPRQTKYPDESQLRSSRAVGAAPSDQAIQLPESADGEADLREQRRQIAAGASPAKVLLDDPGERLSLALSPRQRLVRLQINRDRLYSHALTVSYTHLTLPPNR